MHLIVFRNRKRPGMDAARYEADAVRMEEAAQAQPGFVSFKSYVSDDGEVIALSEWESEEAARAWGRNPDHAVVQGRGRNDYYAEYTLFSCENPRIHRFERKES